jgi:hypothetical protein
MSCFGYFVPLFFTAFKLPYQRFPTLNQAILHPLERPYDLWNACNLNGGEWCCYPFLGSKKTKREKIYIYIKKYSQEIQKIIRAKKGYWNAEKRPKLVEEVQKCKRVKFDSIFLTDKSPVDKENSIWKRKVRNQMFMDSIKLYLRFNWIFRGFDCKKKWFLSQFRLLLEEIKVLGSNYNFEELIWSNQGLNCIIIEVWWSIRDLIETIRNQGPNQKRR